MHVDIGEAVSKLKVQGLGQQFWPMSAAVDALATEASRLKKKGIDDPYVYVDVKTFMPPWAELQSADIEVLSDAEDEQSKGSQALASVLQRGMLGTQAKQKKRLDLLRYSIVDLCCGLSFLLSIA